MSSLINVSINLQDLPKEKFVQGKKGVYYNFTISVNDETNQFGKNVALFDSQTVEEREAKKDRHYIGNGKVVWTNGKCVVATQEQSSQEVADTTSDLPF
tara:strand:+ start:7949 stop:8245 length:297 start_codon:yes stop_codon:yes gene_type:complete